jgi:hypothetical protein
MFKVFVCLFSINQALLSQFSLQAEFFSGMVDFLTLANLMPESQTEFFILYSLLWGRLPEQIIQFI